MRNHVATRKVDQRLKFAKFADMDETKVITDESGRSSFSALRIRYDVEFKVKKMMKTTSKKLKSLSHR